MKLQHVYHLFRRGGFGITPKKAMELSQKSRQEVVALLFQESSEVTPLNFDLSPFEDFFEANPNATYREFKPIFEKYKDLQFPLNKAWLERICHPNEALNERMTLFWANVFVCKDNVVSYVKQFNETLRRHALGNFVTLTKAVSKEPAMIRFLNNNQNKKDHPNENFARELMELFTLGLGEYSETDVKEAARAFTGYSHWPNGDFVLRVRHHDYGEKEFFGFKGRLDGDDIIEIIANQRASAKFICRKLYAYLVNDTIDENRVEEMTDVFYRNYNTKELLEFVFNNDWFYDDDHIGTKIKSPIDLLSSMNRMVPFRFTEGKQHLYIQRILGQQLFHPPNVAGWKGGRAWIDTNTILLRMKMPSVLLGNGLVPFSTFSDGNRKKTFGDRIRVQKNWPEFKRSVNGVSNETLLDCLLPKYSEERKAELLAQSELLSRTDFCILLMSTPEFQLS